MKGFEALDIEGVFRVKNFFAEDNRGSFVKTFHQGKAKEMGFAGSFAESYYSQSRKGVIRGMHFQTPPHDHEKLVYVTAGRILDVILDLRKSSPTYGNSVSAELAEFGDSVFIPKGCAHGFLTLSTTATVVYNVTTVYQPESDRGVRWNSFGFDWGIEEPVMSDRDKSFSSLASLEAYF